MSRVPVRTGRARCVIKFGSSGGTQRYPCNACRRTFSALTRTPFSRLREKDKLLANAECMVASLSVRKAAEKLQVSVKKAFRWRHRFLEFLAQQRPSLMTGVIEADETFFARSFKGQRRGLQKTGRPSICPTTWAGGSCSTDSTMRLPRSKSSFMHYAIITSTYKDNIARFLVHSR